jgi:hypothetical protein
MKALSVMLLVFLTACGSNAVVKESYKNKEVKCVNKENGESFRFNYSTIKDPYVVKGKIKRMKVTISEGKELVITGTMIEQMNCYDVKIKRNKYQTMLAGNP